MKPNYGGIWSMESFKVCMEWKQTDAFMILNNCAFANLFSLATESNW